MQKKRKKKIYRKFFNLILIFAEYELSVEIIIRYIVLNLEKYLFKFFIYIFVYLTNKSSSILSVFGLSLIMSLNIVIKKIKFKYKNMLLNKIVSMNLIY